MKVVCPFTDLTPATYRALKALNPNAHQLLFVPLHDDPVYGYGRLLRKLWAEGEGFVLVEHDIVPHLDTVDRFADCEYGYCAAPYEWTTCVGVALGCTKFSTDFLARFPLAAEIACRIPSNHGGPGHYRQLDVWLQAAVLRDLYGQQPHCHLPPVVHLNDAQRLLPPYQDSPVAAGVYGRTHLRPGLVEEIAATVEGKRG